jgi:hypothetical protein
MNGQPIDPIGLLLAGVTCIMLGALLVLTWQKGREIFERMAALRQEADDDANRVVDAARRLTDAHRMFAAGAASR